MLSNLRRDADEPTGRAERAPKPDEDRLSELTEREHRGDSELHLLNEDARELGVAHDPLQRALARPGAEVQAPPRSLAQLDPRLAEMIQKVAWGRSGSSATLRLELGGKLRGAVLLLEGDDRGGVRVAMELPHGEDPQKWQQRLAARFQERGLRLDALEVQ